MVTCRHFYLLFYLIAVYGSCVKAKDLAGGGILAFSPADFSQACPKVSPQQIVPGGSRIGPLHISVTFEIDKIIGIDNVREKLAVRGSFQVTWELKNLCSEKDLAPIHQDSPKSPVVIESSAVGDIWHPAFYFTTSVNHLSLERDDYEHFIRIVSYGVDTTGYHDIHFRWEISGIFETECPLDLSSFPQDVEICTFSLRMRKKTDYIKFYEDPINISNKIVIADDTNRASSQWQVVPNETYVYVSRVNETLKSIGVLESGYDYSQVNFKLGAKRRPNFFITNTMLPSAIMATLNIAAGLLIPPDVIDRVGFNIGLVMSLSVYSSAIVQGLPETPQDVFLADFTVMLTLFSALCTVESMFMFWFTSAFVKAARRKCCNLISIARIVDTFGVLCVAGFLSWLCYPALEIICKSNYHLQYKWRD